MSTAGSGPNSRQSPVAGRQSAPGAARGPRLFRWQGLIALALIIGLLFATWILFADRIVRAALEEAGRKALGTQVEIAGVQLGLFDARLRIEGVRIADPFDPMRNLLEVDTLRAQLDGRALIEQKVIIERLTFAGGRAGTRRTVAAKPVRGGGFAPAALREWARWKNQFDVPLLSLTPVDTIRAIALDPTQLVTVRRALAVKSSADSLRAAVDDRYRELRLRETLDSTRALLDRLKEANPRTLGIAGTRRAIEDLRRGVAELRSARERVETLEQTVTGGVAMLTAGVRSLDDARREDYQMARGLLKLPSFDSPEIGMALFGPVSIERFQRAMYWADVAEHHLPPGLRPSATAGPERLRMSGTTVRYPKARAYPTFHLERADASLTFTDRPGSPTYAAQLRNLTTAPVLVGAPVRASLRRTGESAGERRITAEALLDHLGGRVRDTAVVTATSVQLPSLSLPGLPLSLDPRAGQMTFNFGRAGDRIAARWHVRSDSVRWMSDTTRALNRIEALVTRVLTGIGRLELTADLEGDIRRPSLRVRSNLDRAVAERLRAVVGEEVARAEAKVRAEVNRIVEERTAPVRAQVESVRADLVRQVEEAKERVESERRELEERLRAMSGGLLGVGA